MLVSGGSTISISDVSFSFGNIGLHWNGKYPITFLSMDSLLVLNCL